MQVPELLLETLEDLVDEELKTFQWYLSIKVLDSCKPIPKSRLDKASRPTTVTRLIGAYGEESAVSISVEILKKMHFNDAAERLWRKHTGGSTASSSTSSSAVAPAAPPATISAQQGSVVIAPTVTGGATSGSWNITINK